MAGDAITYTTTGSCIHCTPGISITRFSQTCIPKENQYPSWWVFNKNSNHSVSQAGWRNNPKKSLLY